MSPPKLLADPEKFPVNWKRTSSLRPLHRQHAQQHLVEKGKHSRIGADAKRQREDHGERKARRLAQLAQRVAKS